MRTLHAVTMFLLLSATASASVILVNAAGPPGAYKTIQVAVNNANPGDTILVQGSGTVAFGETVVIAGKPVTLLADTNVIPRIRTLTISDLPAGGTVVVRGFHVDQTTSGSGLVAITIQNCAGAVRLESVQAQGSHGTAGFVPGVYPVSGARGMVVTACADVAARDCEIKGGAGGDLGDEDSQYAPTSAGDGAVVISSNVALYDCTVQGLDGGSVYDTVTDDGGAGGSGLRNIGGRVFMSGGSALGGNGGSADCDIYGGYCGGGGDGGSGVRQEQATAALFVRNATAKGGSGGYGPSLFGPGVNGKAGHPITVNAGAFTQFAAASRGFSALSPVREGAPLTLAFTGEAGDAALLLAGTQLGQYVSEKLQGALLVTGHYSSPAPIYAGGIAVSGTPLLVTLTVPDLPAGLQDATFHMQSLFKPASGPTLLGPASTTTVIDDVF